MIPKIIRYKKYNFETIKVGGFRDYGGWSQKKSNTIGVSIQRLKNPNCYPEMEFVKRKVAKGKRVYY